MTPERWSRVKELLGEALDLPAPRRAAFLRRRAGEDAALVREVEEMLSLETAAAGFIERPVFELIGRGDAGDRAGQILGPYRLVHEVGHGGMGTVYLAERADDEFERQVAVKVLKRGLDTDEVIRRFRRERQILAGLDHPHVARLLDGGTTDDGLPYLVMEYVEGRPIDVYCRQEGLGVEERLRLFLAVCEGVEEAHRRLVVHRDLKPRNVLVTADGVPKLLDFGIAKLLDPVEDDRAVTLAGWRFLTPPYASPEQIDPTAAVTTGTDVWSLGVVLYQLLADERPYDLDENSPEGLARALATGPPKPPSERAPAERAARLRGDLDNIALMALRRDPSRRYAGVGQLADDLRRHLDGQPVKAAPDSVGYRVGKFVRRHRLGVAVAAAFVLTVLAFAVVSWVLRERAQREERAATATTAFLVDMIAYSDPDASGAEVTLLRAIDHGRELLRERLPGQPDVRSRLLLALGKAYSTLDELDRAEEVLTEALELRRAMGERDSLRIAEIKNELGGVIVRRRADDRLAVAEELTRDALAIRSRDFPQGSEEILEIQTNLAMILDRQEEFEEADALHRVVLAGWPAVGNRREYSTALNNYASSLQKRGRSGEAVPLLEEVVEIRRQELGDEHTRYSTSLNNLGSALESAGELVAAGEAYARALAVYRKAYGDDSHGNLVMALNNLGLARHKQGEPGEAVGHLEEAVEMAAELELSPGFQAVIQRNLAAVLTDVDPRRAEEIARAALEVYAGAPDEWRRYDAESVLGGTLVRQGRFAAAEELLLPSLPRIEAAPAGPDSRYAKEARQRIVELYETSGRPELAGPYREAGPDVEPGAGAL